MYKRTEDCEKMSEEGGVEIPLFYSVWTGRKTCLDRLSSTRVYDNYMYNVHVHVEEFYVLKVFIGDTVAYQPCG